MPNVELASNTAAAPQAKGLEAAPQAKATRPAAEVAPAPKISIKEVALSVAAAKNASVDQLDRSAKEVKEAIDSLNSAMARAPTTLQFSIDSASKRFVVQVTDSSTGEVILKFPGDAVLRVAQNIESMKGVLFDEVL